MQPLRCAPLKQTMHIGPLASDHEFNQLLVSRFAIVESTVEGRAQLEGLKKDVLATLYHQVVFTHSDTAVRSIW